jgi:DMSO/TMAO reductase YedYZ molybdopterin-dependent catalytic subunit
MAGGFISRGFRGRRQQNDELNRRLPPGQYTERGFPVLSVGPTPRVPLEQWDFSIEGKVKIPIHWTWAEFQALPHVDITTDIHCVTKWSKFDTHWAGVPVEALLQQIEYEGDPHFVVAFSEGGYTTNLPLADVLDHQAWIVDTYEGQPLAPEHGGPARLLVPHLYFWKSAKWVRGFRLLDKDEPGFWESFGYHNYGDPWKEQRYWGD